MAAERVTVLDHKRLKGKRVGLVVLSSYPQDPRPRRAADAFVQQGMSVDYICLANGKAPWHEKTNGIDVFRVPIVHRRGGKLAYAYEYSAFILVSAAIFLARSLRHRYDLIYVNNMPDILVASALLPKIFGAKVILDLHDPMPELMTAIFGLAEDSLGVRILRRLEKWSMARANLVLTVNLACKKIFGARSCRPEKIGVIMNSPDGEVFPFREASQARSEEEGAKKRFVVMYHGSLLERNGLDLAVDALLRVRQTIPAAELKICGAKTPFLERVMNVVREKGLQDAVHYLGQKRLEEIVREIENCDVGVIPNRRNAFTEINTPTRIFEYLALGKPVIAPRARGVEDYFNDDSLLLFELGNSEDLARKIAYVYSQPSKVIGIVKRGQKIYQEHTWQRQREILVQHLSEVLNGGN